MYHTLPSAKSPFAYQVSALNIVLCECNDIEFAESGYPNQGDNL